MEQLDTVIEGLRIAEQQFRLACTVHLAVTNGAQTLDVPVEWTFGKHRVSYEDFGLRPDQAELVASALENTATFVLAGAIRDAILANFNNPKDHEDANVVSAYQISRLLRNAFSHSMIWPKWSIDGNCQGRVFDVAGVISLDTNNLHDQHLRWPHYGGPLAIFYLGRHVREKFLNDLIDPARRKPQFPKLECYQQGRLILQRVEELPPGALMVSSAGPGETLNLGDGHHITIAPKSACRS